MRARTKRENTATCSATVTLNIPRPVETPAATITLSDIGNYSQHGRRETPDIRILTSENCGTGVRITECKTSVLHDSQRQAVGMIKCTLLHICKSQFVS